MDSILNFAKQLSDLGIVTILLLFICLLGWYIMKVREPYERTLEQAIERIGSALTQIAETNERTARMFESQSSYLKDNLGENIKSLKSSVQSNSELITVISNKMDLLLISQNRTPKE